jgi:DNA-binding CsgD family transcriptional regulator
VLAISELALELVELLEEARQLAADQRLEALGRVQRALSHLRGLKEVADVLERGPEELVRTVGFDRGVLFRVHGSNLAAQSHYFSEQQDWAKQVLEFAKRHQPRLDHMLLETEMIRRRAPLLVSDAQNDPRTDRGLVGAYRTRSYVAAPIMPHGRVIGFLHADYYFSGRDVDTLDRDALWTFAEGFGYAFERTSLHGRMLAQRNQMRRLMAAAETVIDDLCNAEVELAAASDDSDSAVRAAASMVMPARPLAPVRTPLDTLLTRRELEVLAMMADGATNAWIAEQLVISPGTVKSHVKHILRKMRSSNRAEAVSRYMKQLNANAVHPEAGTAPPMGTAGSAL